MPSLSEHSSDQILLDGERNPTNFHMVTQVSLVTETGLLSADTRTWSNANWVGFIGGVQVYILDGNDHVVALTQVQDFAVNGRRVPGSPSLREDRWTEQFDPDRLQTARKLLIIQCWDPHNSLIPFLQALASDSSMIGCIWDEVANEICKVYPGFSFCATSTDDSAP